MSTSSKTNPPPQQQANTSSEAQSQGTFTLLLFASAQSYCDDKESLQLSAPMTLKQLFEMLEKQYPGFGEKVLKSSQFSINLEYTDCTWRDTMDENDEEVVLKAGDEIAIIPPVSSG